MTTDQLDPELLTIGRLFDEGEVYTVPVYQRNYAWRAEQIEQLISDVQDSHADGEDGYFLGNLVVTRRRAGANDYEVIDGQQRLTTLHLLLTLLGQDGGGPSGTHQDRLRYESRPKAVEALRRVAASGSGREGLGAVPVTVEDGSIHEGFNIMRQFVDQHPVLRHADRRAAFADYLRSKVTVVRVVLPTDTDLNRYFEIMNTRGQQLQQVDIVKARLMSCLPAGERACFAWIWDACADMDSYVQMALTRGDLELRRALFGEDWTWLTVTRFEALHEVHKRHPRVSLPPPCPAQSLSPLDAALLEYAALKHPAGEEDPENVRFRSTIEFPAFLLHVLAVVEGEAAEGDGSLDDKRLIKRFGDAVRSRPDAAEWVRGFGAALLRLRNLFDALVLKRQSTATREDGDWSLLRFARGRVPTGRRTPPPRYLHTFQRANRELEEDGDSDSATADVLLLQSMLRITYTSPRTMHWITQLLVFVDGLGPEGITAEAVGARLRDYARDRVRESFVDGVPPMGFHISRIVFTYLDYLLLAARDEPGFRFVFRNSIEHFYPQSPDEEQAGGAVTRTRLDLLGNLALVSVSANSKFSNSLPRAKAENFRTTIEAQSPKLRLMAELTRDEGWADAQVQRHHDDVVRRLQEDVGVIPGIGGRRLVSEA